MSEQRNTPKYIEFLNNHPACVADYCLDIFSAGVFWTYNCSKDGEAERDPIYVYRDDPKFKKFQNRFNTGDEYILVSSEEYHNKKWVYDHTIYGGELPIKVYTGKFTNNKKDKYNPKNWTSYQGVSATGKTFDEMIDRLYEETAESYGNFQRCEDDFLLSNRLLTVGEIENHRNVKHYIKVPKADRKIGNAYHLIENKDYFDVTNPIYNRRWVKEFIKMDYYKTHWDGELDMLVKNTPEWVWDLSKKRKGKT